MLVAMIAWFIPVRIVQTVGLTLVWVVVLAGITDAVLTWRRIKKGLLAKYGSVPRGGASYTITRAMQIRRGRFPRPAVKRGDKVG